MNDFSFLKALAAWLPPDRDAVFLDAGANIGGATLLFALTSGLSGQVVSVEASPGTYELLLENVAPLGSNIVPVNKALVAHDVAESGREVEFAGEEDEFWGFRVDHTGTLAKQRSHNATMVPTTSLPQLKVRIFSRHPNVVSIQVLDLI